VRVAVADVADGTSSTADTPTVDNTHSCIPHAGATLGAAA
jgi:hypothetical protein